MGKHYRNELDLRFEGERERERERQSYKLEVWRIWFTGPDKISHRAPPRRHIKSQQRSSARTTAKELRKRWHSFERKNKRNWTSFLFSIHTSCFACLRGHTSRACSFKYSSGYSSWSYFALLSCYSAYLIIWQPWGLARVSYKPTVILTHSFQYRKIHSWIQNKTVVLSNCHIIRCHIIR